MIDYVFSKYHIISDTIVYGTVSEKIASRYTVYEKSYKNASHLNRYNFRTVKAIGLLFSALHTTPFLGVKNYFGVLQKYSADVTRSDTHVFQNLPNFRYM